MIWYGLSVAIILLISVNIYFKQRNKYGGPWFDTIMCFVFGGLCALGIAWIVDALLSNVVPTTTTVSDPIEIGKFSIDGKEHFIHTTSLYNTSGNEEDHYYWYEDGALVTAPEDLVNLRETQDDPYIEYVYVSSNWPWLSTIGDFHSGDLVNIYLSEKP